MWGMGVLELGIERKSSPSRLWGVFLSRHTWRMTCSKQDGQCLSISPLQTNKHISPGGAHFDLQELQVSGSEVNRGSGDRCTSEWPAEGSYISPPAVWW